MAEEKDVEEQMSIVNMKGGAYIELIDNAIQKVIENIHDINTTAQAREVVFKLKMQPVNDENRGIFVYSGSCNKKLAGQEAVKGTGEIKIVSGKLVAIDSQEKQTGLPLSIVGEIGSEKE